MKSKLIILSLFLWFGAIGQTVPDTNTFSLWDVLDAVQGNHSSGNLYDAFTYSDAAKFDTNYGSKYMNPKTLYGFRNYGSTTGRVPTVYSESIYSYSNANAQLIGRLTDRGDPLAVIADIGFCFSTSTNPTILDNIAAINTFLEGDTTRFLCTLNSLSNNTPYYARAYAKNSTGTSYGANLTFTTSSSAYCEVTNSFNPTCALNISSMLTSCNGWYHVYFEYSEDCTGGTVQAAIYDESSNFIATETISGTWVSLPDSGIYYFVATGYLTTPLYNGYSIVFNHYI